MHSSPYTDRNPTFCDTHVCIHYAPPEIFTCAYDMHPIMCYYVLYVLDKTSLYYLMMCVNCY